MSNIVRFYDFSPNFINMKKVFLIFASVLALGTTALAQDTFYPGFYLGVKGGVGETVGETQVKNLLSPAAAIDFGWQITPTFGLRADVSGWQGKGWYSDLNSGYKFNYGQLAVDATFDFCNMFSGKYRERAVNPYIFVGVGGNMAFNNGADKAKLPTVNNYWADKSFSPVGRLGLGIDFRLGDLVTLQLEALDNVLNDKFNSKVGDKVDHQIDLLLGLRFNIGAANAKKAEAAALAAAAAAAEAAAAKAAAEKAEAERLAAEKAAREKAEAERLAREKAEAERLAAERAEAERLAAEKAAYEAAKAQAALDAVEAAKNSNNNVYFTIGKSDINSNEMYKIKKLIKKLQSDPQATATICGFADKYTGDPERNMILSEARATDVAAEIVKAGIDPSRVKTFWYGDTVEVSKSAAKNRVSVMVSK